MYDINLHATIIYLTYIYYTYTLVSLYSYLAFSFGKQVTGQPPATLEEVMNIAATGYGLKLFLSVSLTPLIYVVKSILTDKFGLKPIPSEPIPTEATTTGTQEVEQG